MSAEPGTHQMSRLRMQFVNLAAMDLLARTGYQMGKSPLLPLFAAALGAGPEMTGIVVAISTTTGLISTPPIGTLSDRYGRFRLLLIGTAFFAFMPFLYLFIQTPAHLFFLRVIHGFATAIYGPVVSALVADMFQQRRGEYMGWYHSTRTASYLLGPLLGGFVLFYADFRMAWVAVGVLGLAAFLPAMTLRKTGHPPTRTEERTNPLTFVHYQLLKVVKNPGLLSLGIVEASLYLGLRASKAFLPLYAVSIGLNPAKIGLILSIQVAATLFAQPIGGYFSDRFGRRPVILTGLALVTVGLPLIFITQVFYVMALLSVVLGLGEAAIMPSIISLGTELCVQGNYGSTLGVLDAMDNIGKALGPIIAGLLIGLFGYVACFTMIAGLLLLVAGVFSVKVRPLVPRISDAGETG
jgi:MFS family permease